MTQAEDRERAEEMMATADEDFLAQATQLIADYKAITDEAVRTQAFEQAVAATMQSGGVAASLHNIRIHRALKVLGGTEAAGRDEEEETDVREDLI